jgi:hypothetical protein
MSSSHTNCVVLLPIYTVNLSDSELLATRKNLDILSDWPQVILAPLKLEDKIEQSLFSGISGDREYIYLEDKHFDNITSYDQLLRHRWFYELFTAYEYMLLIQTDVVVFRDELNTWIEKAFSYIGAPWVVINGNEHETYQVGNGGLSLRRIPDFLMALDKIALMRCPNWYLKKLGYPWWSHFIVRYLFGFNRWVWPKKTHEDFFWSQLIPSTCKDFRIASSDEAFLFSIEVVPGISSKKISEQTPFGLHAWEKHLSGDDRNYVLDFIGCSIGEMS